MYGQDTRENNPCTVGIHEITIHVRSIPTVHELLSHVSWPYVDCYLMYPDRTWIVISCIPTVHGLLSHVSRPYMDCYLKISIVIFVFWDVHMVGKISIVISVFSDVHMVGKMSIVIFVFWDVHMVGKISIVIFVLTIHS
jgi:hypothetical protein